MIRGEPTQLLAEDDVITVEILTEGPLFNMAKGVWSFAVAHPVITATAGLWASDAIKKYNDNKKKTINMYAKDAEQKNHMQAVVNQMIKGGYTLVKQLNKGSAGYEWELKAK